MTDINHASSIWVVDPIDGTQPFLCGIPTWCASIAFVLNGTLEFGLIYNPPCDELFVGGKSFPATVNEVPLRPNLSTDFSAGLVSIGFSPRSPPAFLFDSLTKLLAGKGMFFRNGLGALSLAYVGADRLWGVSSPICTHGTAWVQLRLLRQPGER